jgi:hypothetical protein
LGRRPLAGGDDKFGFSIVEPADGVLLPEGGKEQAVRRGGRQVVSLYISARACMEAAAACAAVGGSISMMLSSVKWKPTA